MRPDAIPFPAAGGGRPARISISDRKRSRRATAVLVFIVFGLTGYLRAGPALGPTALRFGFSVEIFADVNESDTRAALKIWARTLGDERGVPIDPTLPIFSETSALKAALLSRAIDAATMTTGEFWALRQVVPLDSIILGRFRGSSSVEYVLLVHRDNPAAQLADLRGQTMNLMTGARASLAATWLETLLLEETLGGVGDFFGRTEHSGKLSRVILPVFFRNVAACVVTREGFRTMSELNPQLGRQLKVLAQSPALVPAVTCFRADFVSPLRDKIIAGLGQIADTAGGRQTFALFQTDQIKLCPLSDLDSSCALLDRHQRLVAAANATAHTTPAGGVTPGQGANAR